MEFVRLLRGDSLDLCCDLLKPVRIYIVYSIVGRTMKDAVYIQEL